MYQDISKELLRVIEPVASAHGLEVVDASLRQGPGRAQVRIVLDTPEGDGAVSVLDCARASREISHGLDAGDLIRGAYSIEVCSPGIDRVLGRRRDFERVVGREVSLETRQPIDGRRRFRGRLVAFEADVARLRVGDAIFEIPFEGVARGKGFSPCESGGANR